MAEVDTDDLVWTAPGPGSWEWLGSHFAGAPTPLYFRVHQAAVAAGIEILFERYGVPLRTMRSELVNGKLYTRLEPLVGADKPPTKAPPAALLWLMTRVHPELRRRTRAAARAFEERPWRARVAEWEGTLKPEQRAKNLALQDEDLASLDDPALADHLRRARDNALESMVLHFDLHGDDLGPLGDLLAHCDRWGITADEVTPMLAGASPSTIAPTAYLGRIAEAVTAAGVQPETVEDVRGASPEAAAALDEYLRDYGWRLVTGYDVCDRALVELPEALVGSIRRAMSAAAPAAPSLAAAAARADEAAAQLRERVPDADRTRFDEVVAEARLTNDLRDDNGPNTVAWPTGLLRRSLLEAGRRLHERDGLAHPDHALELEMDEVVVLLTGLGGPSADAVRERAARRAALVPVRPPARLGPPEPEPPLDAFPAPLRRSIDIARYATSMLEAPADRQPMAGTGIGTRSYRGRARVGHQPDELLRTLEPGDVIVVPCTSPAFNAVLAIAGAIVTEEGGPLSHAAVMARELDIPGVIGAAGVLDGIEDGALVDVDPVAGTVAAVPV